MTDAYIFDCVRTPRGKGKADGKLHEVTPLNLSAQTLVALRERNNLDTSLVEDVILGCVTPVHEQGGNVGRVAALVADYPQTVPGIQINRYCGSGLEAVNLAAAKVGAGQIDLAIGGGVECMSRVTMGSDGASWALDPAVAFKTYFVTQGIAADLLASKLGHTRERVDAYAVESQKRAAKAWEEGRFAKSVIPVRDIIGEVLLDRDETVRGNTTMETLGNLAPAFVMLGQAYGFDGVAMQKYPEIEKINHIHHPGNSSGIVDGASAVLVGSKAGGERAGLKPRARVVATATIGSEPTIMLDGPAAAARRCLQKAGLKATDIDLYELNEAFASVVLAFMDELNVPHDKMNVNGGAIAMGHPLGATGGMLVGTVLDELERRNLRYGMIALCEAAGMASATIIERI